MNFYMNQKQKDFGVPQPDNTPMGIIGMEGNLYRGITSPTRNRPMWVRAVSVFLCFFALFLPGLCMLAFGVYVALTSYKEDGLWALLGFLVLLLLGLLPTLAGLAGIKAQFGTRSSKENSENSRR